MPLKEVEYLHIRGIPPNIVDIMKCEFCVRKSRKKPVQKLLFEFNLYSYIVFCM